MRQKRIAVSGSRAFSLIELMTAAAILVVVITGSLLTYINCMLLNDSSRNLVTAANDAQYVLEQIKALDYSSISAYTPPSFSNLSGETVTLTNSIGATLATVTVNVSWTENQTTKSFSLSTYFAK